MRKVLMLVCCFNLFFICSLFSTEYLLDSQFREVIFRIQSLNLINALNLDQKQVKEIILLNEELAKYLDGARPKFQKIGREYADYENLLLTRGHDIAQDRYRKVDEIHQEELRLKAGLEDLFNSLRGRLDVVLSAAQKKIAADFNPCIVPPDDYKNPVRSGQAGTDDRFVKLLETFRRLPAFLVNIVFENFWDKMTVRVKMLLREDEKVAAHKEKVLGIIMKARKLDEVDFQLRKKELAGELIPELPQIYTLFKSGDNWGARFLLNPVMLELYRKLLNRYK